MPFFDYDEKFRMDKIKVENLSSLLFPRCFFPRVSFAPALPPSSLPLLNFVCSKINVFLLEDECHGKLRGAKDNKRESEQCRGFGDMEERKTEQDRIEDIKVYGGEEDRREDIS